MNDILIIPYNKGMERFLPTTSGEPLSSEVDVTGYFDEQSAGWALRYQSNRHFQKRLALAMTMLPMPEQPFNLLDYGCGGGVLLKALIDRGHQVVGADISSGMLKAAASFLPTALQAGQLRLMPVDSHYQGAYQAESFDGVFCLGVLEYLSEPQTLLSELSRVVKPGGFLILSLPNSQSLLRRLERWIFEHPALFRRLGLFSHLTDTDSYLCHQKSWLSVNALDEALKVLGLHRQVIAYHVAPSILGSLESHASFGMTVLLRYQRVS